MVPEMAGIVPEDIERYYTDIRGGRPPSREHLAELRSRYAAIGDQFPLLEITRAQWSSKAGTSVVTPGLSRLLLIV